MSGDGPPHLTQVEADEKHGQHDAGRGSDPTMAPSFIPADCERSQVKAGPNGELVDVWVETRMRLGGNTKGHTDKYYYFEAFPRRKLRSLKEIQRLLADQWPSYRSWADGNGAGGGAGGGNDVPNTPTRKQVAGGSVADAGRKGRVIERDAGTQEEPKQTRVAKEAKKSPGKIKGAHNELSEGNVSSADEEVKKRKAASDESPAVRQPRARTNIKGAVAKPSPDPAGARCLIQTPTKGVGAGLATRLKAESVAAHGEGGPSTAKASAVRTGVTNEPPKPKRGKMAKTTAFKRAAVSAAIASASGVVANPPPTTPAVIVAPATPLGEGGTETKKRKRGSVPASTAGATAANVADRALVIDESEDSDDYERSRGFRNMRTSLTSRVRAVSDTAADCPERVDRTARTLWRKMGPLERQRYDKDGEDEYDSGNDDLIAVPFKKRRADGDGATATPPPASSVTAASKAVTAALKKPVAPAATSIVTNSSDDDTRTRDMPAPADDATEKKIAKQMRWTASNESLAVSATGTGIKNAPVKAWHVRVPAHAEKASSELLDTEKKPTAPRKKAKTTMPVLALRVCRRGGCGMPACDLGGDRGDNYCSETCIMLDSYGQLMGDAGSASATANEGSAVAEGGIDVVGTVGDSMGSAAMDLHAGADVGAGVGVGLDGGVNGTPDA